MNNNKFTISFSAISENESFARSVISCFMLKLNPSIAELSDVKTAVSEAVTNCIVHGYPDKTGEIIMSAEISGRSIHINIKDYGVGIDNLEMALEPFYTTRPEDERSGMGFTIMKSFMDEVKVESIKGEGTDIYMKKYIFADDGEKC